MELSNFRGLCELVDRALESRTELAARLERESTDAYRLFHGAAEGAPGVTIDRYGSLVLVQTFRSALEPHELAALESHLRVRLPFELDLVYNHRGKRTDESFERWHRPRDEALRELVCREFGVRYLVRGRHRGQDPWLFLDLRAGRRFVLANARDRSALILFAYTCSAGVCAAAGGASEIWNADFSRTHLAIGERNFAANAIDLERVRFIAEDCFPVLRQLAGLPVKGRASSRSYVKLEARQFDLVVLDPPAWSKGPFGAVDVERDYASLFKPALLATASGGRVLATNHVASVALDDWIASLRRCAEKAGRPLRAIEPIAVEPDFPSLDGRPPLKIVVCEA